MKDGAASASRRALVLGLAGAASLRAFGHAARANERLPVIGPAPAFSLVRESGEPFGSAQLRGKVAAVTFIYAACTDTCPMLTSKLVALQKRLAPDFPANVHFVAITVDPVRDTPAVLRGYAEAHGADLRGWAFLTGTPEGIGRTVRDFGAYARRNPKGDVDHLFLTSLVDRKGAMRVQYVGYRFDPREMLRDLRALLAE